MKNKKFLSWGTFMMVAILSCLAIVFLQQRYTTMQQGGGEIQWPVRLERTNSWIPSDYLTVKYLGTRTTWLGKTKPPVGYPIYVSIGVQPNGMVYIKNASDMVPNDSNYIMANLSSLQNGIVDFTIPYNRVRVDIQKVDPAFYNNNYKGILLATLKVKEGQLIITGVYSQGVTIDVAKPDPKQKIEDGEALLIPKSDNEKKIKDMNKDLP